MWIWLAALSLVSLPEDIWRRRLEHRRLGSLSNSLSAAKGKRGFDALMGTLANVIFMGRSYGFSVILVSQRFDAETIKTSYREQFAIKVHMGSSISQQSATMLFPNAENLDKSVRLPPCCGYMCTPKTDCETIIIPKVDIPELDRRLKTLGENHS